MKKAEPIGERLTVTRAEAAKLMGVSITTIKRWIKAKSIPFVRVGRRTLIKKRELDALLENGCELPRR